MPKLGEEIRGPGTRAQAAAVLESRRKGGTRALEGLSEEEQQRQAGQTHSPLCPADGVPETLGTCERRKCSSECLLNV